MKLSNLRFRIANIYFGFTLIFRKRYAALLWAFNAKIQRLFNYKAIIDSCYGVFGCQSKARFQTQSNLKTKNPEFITNHLVTQIKLDICFHFC